MRGESTRRAVTGGADPLTGRDWVDGDRHQVNTVGGQRRFCRTWGASEEALRGPGPFPGVVEGRVGGGRREGGGRTEGGGGRRLVGGVLLCVRLRWGRGGEEGEVALRQVWPLQGCLAASLAAAGPLQCRYARPPFNGAAAVGCFLLSSSLLFSSCMVSNKNRNNTEIAI